MAFFKKNNNTQQPNIPCLRERSERNNGSTKDQIIKRYKAKIKGSEQADA